MMLQYAVKVLVSAIVLVAVAELAKRSTVLGGLLASLPITSLLALTWLYLDTGDTARVGGLATSIFWLVLPSLVLFVALPQLLRSGVGFWPSLLLSSAMTLLAYGAMLALMQRFGSAS
ncbi:MAG TPA: DUF3147 family protein [Burkholderiales bacterium]|nr:DUF3147 family protein [Burkholderiales bacterium]